MDENITILVVDDDKAIINIFEYGLRERGYEVHSAGSGAEALKFASTIQIDFLLCDIKLPDTNGIELTAELHEDYPDMLAILMTGYPGIKSAIQGLRENVQDYLIKPFSVDQVVASIERALKSKRIQSENVANQNRIQELEAELENTRDRLARYEETERGLTEGALGALRSQRGQGHELARQSYALQSQPKPPFDDEQVGDLNEGEERE